MKKFKVIIGLLLLLALTSCSSIEDTNSSEDTTLSSITDNQILG